MNIYCPSIVDACYGSVTQSQKVSMSVVGSLNDEGPQLPGRLRQFLAIMLKNVLLQIRSNKCCGCRISGVLSILLDILIPTLFIGAMCFVRGIPDVDTYPRVFKEVSLRGSDWEYPHLGAYLTRKALCPVAQS